MTKNKSIYLPCLALLFVSTNALAEKTGGPQAPVIPNNTQLKAIVPPSKAIQSIPAGAQQRTIKLPKTKQAAPTVKIPTNSIKRDTVKLPTSKKPVVSISIPNKAATRPVNKPTSVPANAIGKKNIPAINSYTNSNKAKRPSGAPVSPRRPNEIALPGHTLPGFDTGKESAVVSDGIAGQTKGKTGINGADSFANGSPLTTRPGGKQITGFGADGETTVLTGSGGGKTGALPSLGEQGPQLNAKGRSKEEGWASDGSFTRIYNEEYGADGYVYEANDGSGTSSYTSVEDALLLQSAIDDDNAEGAGRYAAEEAAEAAKAAQDAADAAKAAEEAAKAAEEAAEENEDSGYVAADGEYRAPLPKNMAVKKGDNIPVVDETLVRTGPDGQGGGFNPGSEPIHIGDDPIINPRRDGDGSIIGGRVVTGDAATGDNVINPGREGGGFDPDGQQVPQQGDDGGRPGGQY